MTTATAPAILEIANIEVVYNRTVQVLRGLSLKVERGGIVALLGSNGAGKSTVLKAVSRLLELEDGAVTAGRIRYDGAAVSDLAPHELVRRGLGVGHRPRAQRHVAAGRARGGADRAVE